MKATGIVRNVDDLGRIVIPKELRRSLSISIGDSVEFYRAEGTIVIKKYDVAGDMEQMLENLQKSIDIKGYMLTPEQHGALIAKIEEMRAIVSSEQG